MESLSLPSLNLLTISRSASYKQQSPKLSGKARHFNSANPSSFKLTPSYSTHRSNLGGIRMQAGEEDFDLKQMRDMAAAKKRWDALVFHIIPSQERKGGWWSGAPTLAYDKQFLSKVEEKLPKDIDLIVVCQKGLRSLAACELLYNAGYRNLFWVQGGLETAEEEDLVREGPLPLKFAGIGGMSEFLGWTEQQRVQAAREGWGYRLLFSARLVGVFIVADALFIGAQQVGRYIQDIRSH